MHDQVGRRFRLDTVDAGSLSVHTPVYLRRQQVGSISALELTPDGTRVAIEVFIDSPYDRVITDTTVFWNTSGLDIALDACLDRMPRHGIGVAGVARFLAKRAGSRDRPPAVTGPRPCRIRKRAQGRRRCSQRTGRHAVLIRSSAKHQRKAGEGATIEDGVMNRQHHMRHVAVTCNNAAAGRRSGCQIDRYGCLFAQGLRQPFVRLDRTRPRHSELDPRWAEFGNRRNTSPDDRREASHLLPGSRDPVRRTVCCELQRAEHVHRP
jgi:hypothetical protein